MRRKSAEYLFQFPPVHGTFDTGEGLIYIFGEMHESEIEDIILHETLHDVLIRRIGMRASRKLDKLPNYLYS